MKYVEVSPEIFKDFLDGAPFGHKEGDFNVAISEADWTRLRNYFGVPQSVHHSVTMQRWAGFDYDQESI